MINSVKKLQPEVLVAAVLLALAGAFVFYSSISGLVKVWISSDDYSHGFFIIPIALYIAWQKKDEVAAVASPPSLLMAVPLFFVLLVYTLAKLAGIATLASVSMICFVGAVIVFYLGWRALWELIFPVSILFFMVPFPSQIYSAVTIKLQLYVSMVSSAIITAFGIPIFRDGNVLTIPDRTLEVAEACSGIRSLISLFCLGALYGYFTMTSPLRRLILFISAVPIAVAVNIFRITIIVLAIHYFKLDLTVGTAHTLLGFVVFALALFLLIFERWVLQLWADKTA